MIEIYPTAGKPEDRSRIRKKKTGTALFSGAPVSAGSDFRTQLEETIAADMEGSVDELLENLQKQEQKFLADPSFKEMTVYKALVRKILKTAIDQSISMKEIRTSAWKNSRIYNVAEIIDEKFLQIHKTITEGSPAFALMKTMAEIRGLLLDIIS